MDTKLFDNGTFQCYYDEVTHNHYFMFGEEYSFELKDLVLFQAFLASNEILKAPRSLDGNQTSIPVENSTVKGAV